MRNGHEPHRELRAARIGVSGVRAAALAIALASIAGCRVAPAIPLFGAAFPAWLYSMLGGVIATIAVHLILRKRGALALLAPQGPSYLGLFAIFSILIRLIVFA